MGNWNNLALYFSQYEDPCPEGFTEDCKTHDIDFDDINSNYKYFENDLCERGRYVQELISMLCGGAEPQQYSFTYLSELFNQMLGEVDMIDMYKSLGEEYDMCFTDNYEELVYLSRILYIMRANYYDYVWMRLVYL